MSYADSRLLMKSVTEFRTAEYGLIQPNRRIHPQYAVLQVRKQRYRLVGLSKLLGQVFNTHYFDKYSDNQRVPEMNKCDLRNPLKTDFF